MATATRRTTIAADKAVVVPSLSNEELIALLGQTGAIAQSQGEFHRMILSGGILETSDGDIFPPKKDGPALTVRIVKPPIYYNAFFLSDDESDGGIDANRVGRSDLNGRFSKKYDDPAEQAADNNAANDIYDELARATGKRGTFKADIQLQIVPADGEMKGDERVYTLSLSTTSVFEWRGSSKNPSEGSVSDKTFIVKLAELAAQQAAEAGGDVTAQKKAVLDAMTVLRLGGVIADVYLIRASSEKNKNTWTVVSFTPVHIEPLNEPTALPAGEAQAEPAEDDIPF